MKEIELRVVGIDERQVRSRLKAIGAKHLGKKRLKRLEVRLVNTPKLKRWLRVRTDGHSTTFTMKENRGTKENVHEWELTVGDFKSMSQIIQRAFTKNLKAYIESDRDRYHFNNTEITIDKWPKIPPFMEIEGKSKKQVDAVYKKLNIKGKPIGNIWDIYRLYGLNFRDVNRKTNDEIKRILDRL